MKTLKIFFSLFTLLNIVTAKAVDRCESLFVTHGFPDSVQVQFPRLAETQPRFLNLSGQEFAVNNKQISYFLSAFKENPEWFKMKQMLDLLYDQNTFHFPLTKDGFVPAANNGEHHGGYGSYVWYRDLARVFAGVSALPKMLKILSRDTNGATNDVYRLQNAMLRLFTEEEQITRTLQNIMDPEFHKDPEYGFRNVIFVRQFLPPRAEGRKLTPQEMDTESRWAHKQNDAVALFGHSILDGISKGEISIDQLSVEAKAELIYLASYFQRVDFSSMADAGAWEERMGVRTSSVALVTSFLERFMSGWSGKSTGSAREFQFFQQLKSDWQQGQIQKHLQNFMAAHPQQFSHFKNDAWTVLNDSLNALPGSVEKAYMLLNERLGIRTGKTGKKTYGRLVEVEDQNEFRGADSALLHMLLYPPQRLTLRDRIYVINQLKEKLMRTSGFIRYEADWFLHGSSSAIKYSGNFTKGPVSIENFPDMIATRDSQSKLGYRPTTKQDRDNMYAEFAAQEYAKQMKKTIESTGENLEAQWSFQDPMLVQIYVQLYRETRNKTFLKEAWFHLARSLAWITGNNQVNIEGHLIDAYRAPEAWIPARMIHDAKVFIAYFASPNSPLNWTTAELVSALTSFLEVMQENRK